MRFVGKGNRLKRALSLAGVVALAPFVWSAIASADGPKDWEPEFPLTDFSLTAIDFEEIGSSLSWRRRIAVIVLAAGTELAPVRCSEARILRPPQAGCALRTRSTSSSIAAALRHGLPCGRRERSTSPAAPDVA